MSLYKSSEASKYSENCRLLIKALTKFEESDENFEACYKFSLSTLLYHTFKDANSHEVKNKILRLHEKFVIRSEHEKAEKFKNTTDYLINFFNDQGSYEKEKGYRILSLILHLSDSVKTSNLSESLNSNSDLIPTSNIKDSFNFDWISYLKDDVNCNAIVESDSEIFTPDASTEEPASSEEDSLEELPDVVLRPPTRDDSGLGISPDSCSGTSQLFHVITTVTPETISKSTPVDRNPATFYPYWIGKYQKKYGSSPYNLKNMNFTKMWNECLINDDVSFLIASKSILHERNVIKEIIWMLSGIQDLFICQFQKGKFEPNSNIHLSNLTHLGLKQCLNEFCTYADKKIILHNHAKHNSLGKQDCLTVQAYKQAFQEELQIINDSLCDMDRILRKHMEPFTLLILRRKTFPIFNQIDILYQIYKEVSPELMKDEETHVKVCCLLQTLWNMLAVQNIQDQNSKSLKILLRIFLRSCKPYITFLEDLTMLGAFRDPHSEFIIKKHNVSTDIETYWEISMDIRSTRNIDKDFFMNPFITDILSAGKSLEILNKINSLKTEAFRLDAESGGLYLKFLQILQKSICPRSNWVKEKKSRTYSNVSNLEMMVQKDPMLEQQIFPLTSSYIKFFQPSINPAYKPIQKYATSICTTEQELTEKIIRTIEPNGVGILTRSIKTAFGICMQIAYNPICRQLMMALKQDYNIMRHMTVMRKYFLMESGDLMYSFYSEIFWKIFKKEPWRDLSFLYSALQNAIFEDKVNCRKLYIFLNADCNLSSNPEPTLKCLNTFQLTYQVKWPVTMMLGKNAQNEYSQIFTFLLQIKCAKFLLDNLYSLSLCKQTEKSCLTKAVLKTSLPREQKMHGMYIIRMRLMFFVNGFHNYIMTRILHSFGVEFHDSLEKAETVEEMITIHKIYLKSVHERCLLDRRILFIKDYIFQALNLCYNFQQEWLKGIDNVNMEELKNIETEFGKINNVLTCSFTKPLRRGIYLNLESLVSTMLWNSHTMYVFSSPDEERK